MVVVVTLLRFIRDREWRCIVVDGFKKAGPQQRAQLDLHSKQPHLRHGEGKGGADEREEDDVRRR